MQPSLPIAVQNDIKRIATALEAEKNKQPSHKEQADAQRDLRAQENMAFWAGLMFWVGLGEIMLTTAGIVLIWRTLIHTKRAADAARDAVDEAQRGSNAADKQSKKEMRSYVAVEPGGINWLIGRDHAIGHVVLRNVGKLPANAVYLLAHMKIAPRENFIFTVPGDFADTARTVQPGATMTQGTYDYLPVDYVRNSGGYIYIYGVAYYEDGFGRRRYTKFCHRYATASHDRTTRQIVSQPLETVVLIGPDKARYYETGNDSN